MARQRQESTGVLQQDDSRFRDRARLLGVLLHRDLADLDGLVQQAEPDSRPQDPAHHFIDQLDPQVARLHRRQQALPPYTVPGELPVQSGVR